jgi:hypothetical protein
MSLIDELFSIPEPNRFDDKLMNRILNKLAKISREVNIYVHPTEVNFIILRED